MWSLGSIFTYFQPVRLHLQGTKWRLPPSSSFSGERDVVWILFPGDRLRVGDSAYYLSYGEKFAEGLIGIWGYWSRCWIFGILWGGLTFSTLFLPRACYYCCIFSSMTSSIPTWYLSRRLLLTLWGSAAWDPYRLWEEVLLYWIPFVGTSLDYLREGLIPPIPSLIAALLIFNYISTSSFFISHILIDFNVKTNKREWDAAANYSWKHQP